MVNIFLPLQEIESRQDIFQHSLTSCDLENRVNVTKIKTVILQIYICACLITIHSFLQELECRQGIFQQSLMSCDLENRVKVTEI